MSSVRDAEGNDVDGDGVFLIKRGLVGGGWVCAPKHMTQMEVQLAVDRDGTVEPYLPDGSGWIVLARKHEDPELQSPGGCGECPEDRRHWFVAGGFTGIVLSFAFEDFRIEDQEEDARLYIESLTVGDVTGDRGNRTVQ